MAGLGADPGSALIVLPGNFTTLRRELIISLAASLRVPTLYPYSYFVDEGGLLSYGVDILDLFRRAPDYGPRLWTHWTPTFESWAIGRSSQWHYL